MNIAISENRRNVTVAFLNGLQANQIPFAIGGALALHHYTGIWRNTKDTDIFLLPDDVNRALVVGQELGFNTWVEDKHWIAKARKDGFLIDMIFGGGNWLNQVTVDWLRRAHDTNILGIPLKVLAPEEIIWSKAYVAHRERFDGADIVHLFRYASDQIDWQHLVNRFSAHRNLLLSYLALFSFAFPWDTQTIPEDIIKILTEDLVAQREHKQEDNKACWGMLLDPKQFAYDIEVGGCIDPREILAVGQGVDPEEVRQSREADWKQSLTMSD